MLTLSFQEREGRNAPPLLKRKVEEFPSPGRAPSNPPALDVLPIPWLQEVNPYFPLSFGKPGIF